MSPDSMMSGWYYAKEGAPVGHETGPLSWEELYLLARAGTVAPRDLVWNPRLPRGVTAGQIPGLFPSAPVPEPLLASPFPAAQMSHVEPSPLEAPLVPSSEAPPTPARPEPTALEISPMAPQEPLVEAVAPIEAEAAPLQSKPASAERATGEVAADQAVERPASTHETESVPERPVPSRVKKQQRSLPWLIVLLAVVVAGAGLTAYFLFLRDTASSPTSSTASAPTSTVGAVIPPASGAGSGWAELDPAEPVPTARSGHVLVFDPSTARPVLFGGSHLGTMLGDTWTFDLGTLAWQQLRSGDTAPSARRYPQMVLDRAGGKLILFGGEDATGSRNDMWAFDPATAAWAELSPAGDLPAPRFGHAMAQDPESGRLILFGGVNSATRQLLDDLWAYDPLADSWTELEPSGDPPVGRMWHSFVYHPGARVFTLFGGYGGVSGSTGANLDDLWVYDPAANRWSELAPVGETPLARQGHTMILDPASGDLLLYGGCDGLTGLGDIWSYDQAAGSWTRVQPAGEIPPGRDGHAMTYDSAHQAMILFGGYDFAGNSDFNDTWTYRALVGDEGP